MGKTLTAVMVGCGGISRAWLNGIRHIPDLQMVGFVDLDEAAARSRAAEYGWHDAAIGSDLAVVLDQTHPDAVFDATIPEAHLPVTLEALRHGCHVLGEKPLADSLDHARQMIDAAREAGKLFAVIQNRRYTPNIRRLRTFIETGALGPLTTLNADFYLGAHFGGFRDHMEHVLLLDMAIHTFDAARFISGADPVSVYCKEWNPAGSWYDHDAAAVAVFEMTNGIVFTYRGSWCAEGLITSWGSDWRVVGQQGTVRWNGEQEFAAQAVANTGGFFSEWRDLALPAPTLPPEASEHAGVIRDFVAALQAGTVPETVGTDNIKSLAMVFGAIESAETGRPVQINV
jgi:predicted dehydrogenase